MRVREHRGGAEGEGGCRSRNSFSCSDGATLSNKKEKKNTKPLLLISLKLNLRGLIADSSAGH